MNISPFQSLVHCSFVRHVERHRLIDSTNNRARRIALGEEPLWDPWELSPKSLRDCLPCLIVADEQSAGRGRGSNRWWTGPGSLAMSLLLPPLADWPQLFQPPPGSPPKASAIAPSETVTIPPNAAHSPLPTAGEAGGRSWPGEGDHKGIPVPLGSPFPYSLGSSRDRKTTSPLPSAEIFPEKNLPNRLLPGREIPTGFIGLAAALAIVHTVRSRLPAVKVGLHWPNDVFAAGKKLAGILTEVVGSGLVIVGIGLNTNNTAQEAPEELRPRLTTLRDLTGQIHPHEQLLPELLNSLEEVFSLLVYLPDRVASCAHQWCLQKGQTLKVHTSRGDVEGICEGIGPQGELLLKTPAGLQRIFSGSIVG